MRSPRNENTSADAMMMLANAMGRGSSDGLIEEQEKRGQTQLVNSDVLPSKIMHGDRGALEAAGVRFLDPVEGDQIGVEYRAVFLLEFPLLCKHCVYRGVDRETVFGSHRIKQHSNAGIGRDLMYTEYRCRVVVAPALLHRLLMG